MKRTLYEDCQRLASRLLSECADRGKPEPRDGIYASWRAAHRDIVKRLERVLRAHGEKKVTKTTVKPKGAKPAPMPKATKGSNVQQLPKGTKKAKGC